MRKIALPQYVLATPAKNEEKNLPMLIQSILEQTIMPAIWVIVDDGSNDGTHGIIRAAQEEHGWIQSASVREHPRDIGRHYAQVCNEGFNFAIKYCEDHNTPYEYIGLVDSDMTLESDLFEKLIKEFEKNPRLGVASGTVYNNINNELIPEGAREDVLMGSPRLWRKKCFEETGGGYLISYSADAVSNVLAKLRGWEVKRFEKIRAIQARKTSSAEGLWKGYNVNGKSDYFRNYHPLFVISKGLKRLFKSPYYIGIAYLYGYLSGVLRRMDKIDNEEIKDYYYHQKHKEIIEYYKNKLRNKLKWGR